MIQPIFSDLLAAVGKLMMEKATRCGIPERITECDYIGEKWSKSHMHSVLLSGRWSSTTPWDSTTSTETLTEKFLSGFIKVM